MTCIIEIIGIVLGVFFLIAGLEMIRVVVTEKEFCFLERAGFFLVALLLICLALLTLGCVSYVNFLTYYESIHKS
jgi:hypothetical protein